MRISTSSIYDTGVAGLGDLQSSLLKTQQQISTGRRMLTPADDPIAAASALDTVQAQSVNTQFGTNRQNVKSALLQEEVALQSVTSLLQDAKVLTVTAGNGTFDDQQRKFLAADLSGRFEELLGLANSRDGSGNYLFAGFRTGIQPFTKTSAGATYNGDQGQRFLQVDSTRQIAQSDDGSNVFEASKTGNATFVTAAAATNVGSGIISSGVVINPVLLTGQNYDINFTVGGGVTTFVVMNTSTGLPVPPVPAIPVPIPYVSGQPIAFDGLQFDVSGSPANGDKFTVKPSTNQSIFATLTNLTNVLNASNTGAAGQANLNNGLNAAHNNINSALDNILSVRASVGSRLKELESLDNAGDDRNLQYSQTLSQLQDLDYTKAISDLSKKQLTLEAAQKSFVKVTSLSLFSLL